MSDRLINRPSEIDLSRERAGLIAGEIDALQAVFGVRFDVSSPSNEIMQALGNQKMRESYLAPWFFPKLELPRLVRPEEQHLYYRYAEKYMALIEKKYPNWHIINKYHLKLENIADTSMPERTYWDHIVAGKTEFPITDPHWSIVETIPKPERKQPYPYSPISEVLGLDKRFISWAEIMDKIKSPRFQRWSDSKYGLKLNWRLPTLIELNIITNRNIGESPGGIYEWTSTRLIHPDIISSNWIVNNYYQVGGSETIIVDGKLISGWSGASIDHDPPDYFSSYGGIGFRLIADMQEQ